MKLTGPDRYTLTLRDRSATVRSPQGKPNFVCPATLKRHPKLYVVSRKGALLYVGATTQPMSTRLRGGLTADGAHGYHGYSWGRKDGSVTMDIWYLDSSTPEDLEAIEAEVVYLYRHESSQWPQEQTEIHFQPSSQFHRDCAARIVDALGD